MRASFLLLVLTACSTDTFTRGDASNDDGSGGDGGTCTQNFCANAKATTCDDFDSPAKDWSNDPTNAPTITIGTTQSTATSCPSALQIVMPAMVAPTVGVEPHGYVTTQLGNPGDVTVAFDAFLPNIPVADGGFVDGMVFFALRGTADGTWSVRLERSGDTAWFLRLHQGAGGASASVPNILTGAWNHMTLTVHYAMDNTGSASLTYQTGIGPQTAPITGKMTLPNTGVQQSTSFAIGAGALSAITQPYTFLYDSITIDAN